MGGKHRNDDHKTASLLHRFADNSFYADILQSLVFDTPGQSDTDKAEERARKRRAHRAEGYQVEGGKLWLVTGKSTRSKDQVECIPTSEAKSLTLLVHSAGGHFSRDMTILALQQRYFWPTLRQDTTEAVVSCPRCKNFGPRLKSAQLQTHHEGETVRSTSWGLPVALAWARQVQNGTGKFTVDALTQVSDWLLTPMAFMANGGKHFDCEEVKTWVAANRTQHITTPAYAPWTNGLADGHVKLLIGRLKRLCTGVVGEAPESEGDLDATTVPESWPKHLAQATAQLNDRLLPSLGYSPRELMTGVIRADCKAELASAIWNPRRGDV
ncbi:hypothetical protein FRC07_002610 [Ceratobasidium sp. 392]|nr:hypothetical protein FRC07_002610 [Ceratobasidium sp. 392]